MRIGQGPGAQQERIGAEEETFHDSYNASR